MIIAKKGDYQKLGYIFTHLAIIISVGGLMDGNLIFKFQESIGSKQIEFLDKPISEISKKSWLDTSNFSFRANMLLVEGESQGVGVIPVKDGYMIQDLPFTVSLKDFNISICFESSLFLSIRSVIDFSIFFGFLSILEILSNVAVRSLK